MHVFDLVGTENNPAYQELAIANLKRQYDFHNSLVQASVALDRPMLSLEVIKALNYHAITCLHCSAGEWRPCEVRVGNDYSPPPFWEVPGRMNMFVDEVNRHWEKTDPVYLAAFVLWKLNHIHPFINGNGRTARIVCFFVLCLKFGGVIQGNQLLPDLIKANRPEYVAALKHADASLPTGQLDLAPLHSLVAKLLSEQMAS